MSSWTESYRSNDKGISRRQLLAGGAVIAGAALGLVKCETALQLISPKRPADKFVDMIDGKPVITEKPTVVKVSYSTVDDKTAPDKINVTIRRKPSTDSKELLLEPNRLSQYATRVFGDGYDGISSGKVSIEYDNITHRGGIWFAMTDSQGNLIKPDGRPLGENEDPYYVAGNFVTVQKEKK